MVSTALRVTETPGSCRIHSDELMSMRVPAARTIASRRRRPRWRALWHGRTTTSIYDEVKGEEKRGLAAMRTPNLAQAQVLVMAWRFALTSYTPRPTRYLSFSLPAISLTSYSSHRIVPAPTAVPVTQRAVLTMPQSSRSWSPPPTSYRPCRRHPH